MKNPILGESIVSVAGRLPYAIGLISDASSSTRVKWKRSALWCAALHLGTVAIAGADGFNWIDGASGDFYDPGRWIDSKNQEFNPPRPNPFFRIPGSGDTARFPQDLGPYTVQIDGASVRSTLTFDRFNGSLITLNVTGTYEAGDSYLIKTRFTGGGILRAGPLLVYDLELSGLTADFFNLKLSSDTLAQNGLVLQDNTVLTSSGTLVLQGKVTMNASVWTHSGPSPVGGDFDVLNGSRLTIRKANAADPPATPSLRVTGGSTVDMDDIQGRVDASGGSAVSFQKSAVLYSDPPNRAPAAISGGGTTLTVSDNLEVTGGTLYFRAGGRLLAGTVTNSSTEATDDGSAINITGLLDGGSVTARDGGSVFAATAKNAALTAIGAGATVTFNNIDGEAGKVARFTGTSGGVLSGGSFLAKQAQGSVRNASSRLSLTGNFDTDYANASVEDGGRIECDRATFGDHGTIGTNVAVSDQDSFLLLRKGLILADHGADGSLLVSSAGRVQIGLPDAPGLGAVIGYHNGANGRLSVTSGGVFDARFGGEAGVGVGAAAKGRATVNTGGRLLASNFSVGALTGGDGMVSGSGAGSSLEVQDLLNVGQDGTGRMDLSAQFITSAREIRIGDSTADNIVTVTGGADLRFDDAVFVGHNGRGTLRVTAGGLVTGSGTEPRIGIGEASSNATGRLEIDGPGSRVRALRGLMYVGTRGHGELMITNGAALDVDVAGVGSAVEESSGVATASGTGSIWTVSQLSVGASPADNLVSVTDGATLQIKDALYVGMGGRGTLRVTSGGQLTLSEAMRQSGIFIGRDSSAATGKLVIDGAGSRLDAPGGQMFVGTEGHGELQITSQASLNLTEAAIGAAGGSSGVATVSGAGSSWTLSNVLSVGGMEGFAGPGEAVPGSLVVASGAAVKVGTRLTITRMGVVTVNGGSINIGGGAAALGTLRVGPGGKYRNNGRLVGAKLVNDSGGTFAPGSSPGLAVMEAGFKQEAGGTTEMEIAGAAPGTMHDQVQVTGNAALNGVLRVIFTNGFAPAAGQVFDLFVADSITGTFASVTVEGLQPEFQHELRTLPDGRLQLVALNAGVAASPQVPVRPSIDYVRGFVVVSYPPELTGWKLQASPNLSAGSWTTLDTPNHALTFAPASSFHFFRLARE